MGKGRLEGGQGMGWHSSQTSSLPLQLPHARMGVTFVLPSGMFPKLSNSTSYSKILNNNTIKNLESHNVIVGFFSDKDYKQRQPLNVRLQAAAAKHIQKKTKLVSNIFVS